MFERQEMFDVRRAEESKSKDSCFGVSRHVNWVLVEFGGRVYSVPISQPVAMRR